MNGKLIWDAKQETREAFIYEGLGNYGGAKPNLTVVSKEYRYIVTYEDESLGTIIFRELYQQIKDPNEMKTYIENHRKEVLGMK